MSNNLEVLLTDATAALRKLDKKKYKLAMLSALNKLSMKARTAVYKAIKDRYRIKRSEINVRLVKANTTTMASVFIAKYRPLPLTKFFVKQSKKGVKVEVLRGRKKLIPGAFIGYPMGRNYSEYGQEKKVVATLPLVLRRQSRNPYPLEGLSGPSYGAMLKNPENTTDQSNNDDMQNINEMQIREQREHTASY